MSNVNDIGWESANAHLGKSLEAEEGKGRLPISCMLSIFLLPEVSLIFM